MRRVSDGELFEILVERMYRKDELNDLVAMLLDTSSEASLALPSRTAVRMEKERYILGAALNKMLQLP